jgi:hypothetical protein
VGAVVRAQLIERNQRQFMVGTAAAALEALATKRAEEYLVFGHGSLISCASFGLAAVPGYPGADARPALAAALASGARAGVGSMGTHGTGMAR